MGNLNETPRANRFTIGLFGRSNVGKSSLINALTGQPIAVTSEVAGTTTDPVYKAMELLPLGPVLFIDTAGLDDRGELGRLRVAKTYEVLRKCDLAIVVADAKRGFTEFERNFIDQLTQRKLPCVGVLNKCDQREVTETELEGLRRLIKIPLACVSTVTGYGIEDLKKVIIAAAHDREAEPGLVEGLVQPGDLAILVTPIDKAAPKGRLILPQQQTIRDLIDHNALVLVTKESELWLALKRLAVPPAIVITDSQVFQKVAAVTPDNIPLTSFSILFARQKADLTEMIRGITRIKQLVPGEKVLIVEGCTHHRQEDDIGKVKLPRWIRQIAGEGIQFEWASGAWYPEELRQYAVVVHCGGCMLNRREMQYRVEQARQQGVCITNYGVLIAYVHGILTRALQPFPAARLMLADNAHV